jgi:uncharacterized protein YutE (UPF0331/DUF86 family)
MTPGMISRRVIVDRLQTVNDLLQDIRSLPLKDRRAFFADRRNAWAAESCLRRSLEALFDAGRHILAKGFGMGVSEYKEIATRLCEQKILSEEDAAVMEVLAGYRNRLVHFYHEVSLDELYKVCVEDLGDVERICATLRDWIKDHPERVDEA